MLATRKSTRSRRVTAIVSSSSSSSSFSSSSGAPAAAAAPAATSSSSGAVAAAEGRSRRGRTTPVVSYAEDSYYADGDVFEDKRTERWEYKVEPKITSILARHRNIPRPSVPLDRGTMAGAVSLLGRRVEVMYRVTTPGVESKGEKTWFPAVIDMHEPARVPVLGSGRGKAWHLTYADGTGEWVRLNPPGKGLRFVDRGTERPHADDDANFVYLVKWTKSSFLHCTWITHKTLVSDAPPSGSRRLGRFNAKSAAAGARLSSLNSLAWWTHVDRAFVQVDRLLQATHWERNLQEDIERRAAAARKRRAWVAEAKRVLSSVRNRKIGGTKVGEYFAYALSDAVLPGYSRVVSEPMDLETIRMQLYLMDDVDDDADAGGGGGDSSNDEDSKDEDEDQASSSQGRRSRRKRKTKSWAKKKPKKKKKTHQQNESDGPNPRGHEAYFVGGHEAWARDVRLVFSNCEAYHRPVLPGVDESLLEPLGGPDSLGAALVGRRIFVPPSLHYPGWEEARVERFDEGKGGAARNPYKVAVIRSEARPKCTGTTETWGKADLASCLVPKAGCENEIVWRPAVVKSKKKKRTPDPWVRGIGAQLSEWFERKYEQMVATLDGSLKISIKKLPSSPEAPSPAPPAATGTDDTMAAKVEPMATSDDVPREGTTASLVLAGTGDGKDGKTVVPSPMSNAASAEEKGENGPEMMSVAVVPAPVVSSGSTSNDLEGVKPTMQVADAVAGAVVSGANVAVEHAASESKMEVDGEDADDEGVDEVKDEEEDDEEEDDDDDEVKEEDVRKYRVKWGATPYAQTTWETEDDLLHVVPWLHTTTYTITATSKKKKRRPLRPPAPAPAPPPPPPAVAVPGGEKAADGAAALPSDRTAEAALAPAPAPSADAAPPSSPPPPPPPPPPAAAAPPESPRAPTEAEMEARRRALETKMRQALDLKIAQMYRNARPPRKSVLARAKKERSRAAAVAKGTRRPRIMKYTKEAAVFKGGRQLRWYQVEGLNWLITSFRYGRNCILADEMGLGKTVQTVAFVSHLHEMSKKTNPKQHPFLMVVPLSTMGHWKREFGDWTDLNTIVYHDEGGAVSRAQIRADEFRFFEDDPNGSGYQVPVPDLVKFDVMITTYEVMMADARFLAEFEWRLVVCDEAQRLKNLNNKCLRALNELPYARDVPYDMTPAPKAHHTRRRLLLSGTPLQNNLTELWTLMNIIEPVQFGSLDGFLGRFAAVSAGADTIGQDSVAQVGQLGAELRPYLLRRLKEHVEKNIPPRLEIIVDVELTTMQKKYYRAIYEKNRSFLAQGLAAGRASAPKLINVEIQLRKCCNHPFLIDGVVERELADVGGEAAWYDGAAEEDSEERRALALLIAASGKFVLMDKLLHKLRSEGRRVLIFSQMTSMLDLIEQYCAGSGYSTERIDGRVKGVARQAAIDRFSEPDNVDAFVFLLSTRAGGVGINLTAADTVIIFDSDWNPQNDLQAMARCHRIGQTKEVKVFRLVTSRTYEAAMFARASRKLGLEQAVLGDGIVDEAGGVSKGGSKGKGKSKGPTKEEVEALLKHGAYGQLLEDDETAAARSQKFCEADIETLLEQGSRTITHDAASASASGSSGGAAGLNFSKATFVGADADSSLDMNDPKFWETVLGKDPHETVLSRLNDGTATESTSTRRAFIKELEGYAQEIISAKLDGEAMPAHETEIVSALSQVVNMSIFGSKIQLRAQRLASEVERPTRKRKQEKQDGVIYYTRGYGDIDHSDPELDNTENRGGNLKRKATVEGGRAGGRKRRRTAKGAAMDGGGRSRGRGRGRRNGPQWSEVQIDMDDDEYGALGWGGKHKKTKRRVKKKIKKVVKKKKKKKKKKNRRKKEGLVAWPGPWNEACQKCGEGGLLALCYTCNLAFHGRCLAGGDVDLDELDDDWQCTQCEAEYKKTRVCVGQISGSHGGRKVWTAGYDETPAEVAMRATCDVYALIALNMPRLEGLEPGSKLEEGADLLLPLATDAVGRVTGEYDGYRLWTAVDNETPRRIAQLTGCDLSALVALNKKHLRGLRADSKLQPRSEVLLPNKPKPSAADADADDEYTHDDAETTYEYRRPSGRAPSRKRWDYQRGCWVDKDDDGDAARHAHVQDEAVAMDEDEVEVDNESDGEDGSSRRSARRSGRKRKRFTYLDPDSDDPLIREVPRPPARRSSASAQGGLAGKRETTKKKKMKKMTKQKPPEAALKASTVGCSKCRHKGCAECGWEKIQPWPGPWNTACSICGDGGEILCCYTCNLAYHPKTCLGITTPVEDIPDDWRCSECLTNSEAIVLQTNAPSEAPPWPGPWNSLCSVCGDGGEILMCYTCNLVYHPNCTDIKGIPLADVPDDWRCRECLRDVPPAAHVPLVGGGGVGALSAASMPAPASAPAPAPAPAPHPDEMPSATRSMVGEAGNNSTPATTSKREEALPAAVNPSLSIVTSSASVVPEPEVGPESTGVNGIAAAAAAAGGGGAEPQALESGAPALAAAADSSLGSGRRPRRARKKVNYGSSEYDKIMKEAIRDSNKKKDPPPKKLVEKKELSSFGIK